MMSVLDFQVLPSSSSNDHQTRILVDGADWLDDGLLGLDPPDLMRQLQSDAGQLIVGRCHCGCLGCGDMIVVVRRLDDRVEWIGGEGVLTFDAASYRAAIARFVDDTSWENLGRRVERRVGEIFAGARIDGGMTFDWASTRIRPGLVHLSFSDQNEQRMLEFSWDGVALDGALTRARSFRRERCDEAP